MSSLQHLHTVLAVMLVITLLRCPVFKPARDPGFQKGKRAIEATFSLTIPGTGLQQGFLNLPRLELKGLGSSHSRASELNAFSVLYRCRLRQGDRILCLKAS